MLTECKVVHPLLVLCLNEWTYPLGKDGHPIQLSDISRISSVWPDLDLGGFHILHRIGYF